MWMGDTNHKLAKSLTTLIDELKTVYPSTVWQTNPQTGTIGDAAHGAQGSASDHNPWLNNTVRAFDCSNSDLRGPNCEELFAMVNMMYGAHDPRVYPDGYAMYKNRITDNYNPGAFRATTADEDPHPFHVHISVSTDQAGYDSVKPWPVKATGTIAPITDEEEMKGYLQNGSDKRTYAIDPWLQGKVWLVNGVEVTAAAHSGNFVEGKFPKQLIDRIPLVIKK